MDSSGEEAGRLILFEDEHLLVVNKPAGMNTHAPSPYAGEGIYEWLKHREPRWASLAIVHRLDKETSGVMVFGKTTVANRSLTEQFTNHSIRKKYLLLTDKVVSSQTSTMVSCLVRVGEKYLSRPVHAGGEKAETHFEVITKAEGGTLVEAEPITGRTHQIRVHAAEQGFPILGDALYGGTKASRVCLHAAELKLKHPGTNAEMTFRAEPNFQENARLVLREAVVDQKETNAWRLIHGASDGWAGWYVERLGDFLLSQSEQPVSAEQKAELQRLMNLYSARGVFHKILNKQVRRTNVQQASPQLVLGDAVPDVFTMQENGLRYELSFNEGYSVGLFLDQRDNRRRIVANHIAAGFPLFPNGAERKEVLNTFAYTCGFSVCAAKVGAKVTSLDLSKKYLEWGKRNFELNQIDPTQHDFIYGDTFDWMKRLGKKGRAYDLIVLDPPTFSQSKEHGAFQAEKDYGELVSAALPILKSQGVLLASTNAARLEPEKFLEMVSAAVLATRRKILQQHYVPQPPDFPVSREEPAYLKTVWLRVS
ncbi:pseudouridine synthase [Pedosphaera parvula]|uniref:Pseudouridine synthase n=1 Tax=Pedosphaera parvula (strain Ellin514) TaxID=320771 RepID=B9XS18_PEDPL|nr:pseudouridine synthase [Pedosphaera parvula]EEF57350.1 pseudouridine synthase [Pedosphaera parvula Ellin514]